MTVRARWLRGDPSASVTRMQAMIISFVWPRTEGKKVVLTSETEAPDGGKRTKAIECQYDKVLGTLGSEECIIVLPLIKRKKCTKRLGDRLGVIWYEYF